MANAFVKQSLTCLAHINQDRRGSSRTLLVGSAVQPLRRFR